MGGGGHCSWPWCRWDDGDIALVPGAGGRRVLLLFQGQVGGGIALVPGAGGRRGCFSCSRGRWEEGVALVAVAGGRGDVAHMLNFSHLT